MPPGGGVRIVRVDDILMPRITETMRDGVLLRWLAPDGASVAEGELIAEVAVEDRVEALESPATGELLHGVAEGTEVEDRVEYAAPFAWLTEPLLVRRDLRRIFDHRSRAIVESCCGGRERGR